MHAYKLYLSHVCKSFNQEVQEDFAFFNARSAKYCTLHIFDSGTGYIWTAIVGRRSFEVMGNTMELLWTLKHGTSQKFSAGSESTKGPMRPFLSSLSTVLVERPVWSHNKLRFAERKHRSVRLLLERLQSDVTTAFSTVLMARATSFINMFSGFVVMSSFELVRG